MRVIYADPGLRDEIGHNAETCRQITRELRRRGIETVVLASGSIHPHLRDELEAIEHFRSTLQRGDNDPESRWLSVFFHDAQETWRDLARCEIGPDDFLLLFGGPAQVMALARWHGAIEGDQVPSVMILNDVPSIEIERREAGFNVAFPDPRISSGAFLFRFASTCVRRRQVSNLCVATFDQNASMEYQLIGGFEVLTLPLPRSATRLAASKVNRPLTIGIVRSDGQETLDESLEDIIIKLQARYVDVRILQLNLPSRHVDGAQEEAGQNCISGRSFTAHLAEADIVLCLFGRQAYRTDHIVVGAEAVANAQPLIVSEHACLAPMLRAFGMPGATFSTWDAQSIGATVDRVIEMFEPIKNRAIHASKQWSMTKGPGCFVDSLMK